MDIDHPLALLGGLSPTGFMRRHWQKAPFLVRSALPEALPGLDRRRLFALAASGDVESRLVVNRDDRWTLRHGPIPRRALPSLATPAWTLLVQGVDLHDDAAHRLLRRFRFIPDARFDDVMVSFATDGGGVGPHVDPYDVFLIQLEGKRRWRVGRVARPRLREDVPLKMLTRFRPSHDWLLGPGDMLYLPPGWAHDGVAAGPCITCSVGFRVPEALSLAAEALHLLAEAAAEDGAGGAVRPRLYADPDQPATRHPARVPAALQGFADAAIERVLADGKARRRALGEALSEPKPGTWFEQCATAAATDRGVVLDRRTRMLHDDDHVFVNGESYRAGGRDATLMRRLADERELNAAAVRRLGADARHLLAQWIEAGWCLNRGRL
jgi:50S ribosomal protein L16 3-hydroxylase